MKTTLELKAVVGINRGPPNSGAYFMKDNTSTSNDDAVVTMSPAGPLFRIPAPYVGVRLMHGVGYGAEATYRFLVMAATWRVDPSLVAAEAVCGGSGAASRARGRGRGQWARSSSAGGIRDAPRCCRRSELTRCGCPLRPLHSRTERRW